MSRGTVYCYYSEESGLPFYFNTETQETTYELLEGVIVYDPATSSPLQGRSTHARRFQANPARAWFSINTVYGLDCETDMVPSVAEEPHVEIEEPHVEIEEPHVECEETAKPRQARARVMTFDDRASIFTIPAAEFVPTLATDLPRQASRYRVVEYAHHNFKVRAKKKVSIDELCKFTAEPITSPLLREVDQKSEKLALQCFKWILNFSGVDPIRNPQEVAEKILSSMSAPVLRDEVMFQLIKQTRENPNRMWLQKTWELFLIVVTCYPCSKKAEPYVKSHFLRQATTNQAILDLANFCLIRFCARCAIGKPLANRDTETIQNITCEWRTCKHQFGASIYEQLWNQRRFIPRFPVPFFMHHVTELLLSKGAEHMEGLFRLPGNLKKVDQVANDVNKGKDTIPGIDLHDTASLFKKWLRDLPEPVVNRDTLPNLVLAFETKAYVPFAQSLPSAHRNVLMFLVGFLQRLVKSETVMKMGPKNYAICFAPNIVQIEEDDDATVKKFTEIAIEFLITLITDWDTSSIYPSREEFMAGK
jgi:hypothetical protein